MTALAFFHFSRLFFFVCFALPCYRLVFALARNIFFSVSCSVVSIQQLCCTLLFHVLLPVQTLFAISVLCSIPRFGRYLIIVYNIITAECVSCTVMNTET